MPSPPSPPSQFIAREEPTDHAFLPSKLHARLSVHARGKVKTCTFPPLVVTEEKVWDSRMTCREAVWATPCRGRRQCLHPACFKSSILRAGEEGRPPLREGGGGRCLSREMLIGFDTGGAFTCVPTLQQLPCDGCRRADLDQPAKCFNYRRLVP